MKTLDELDQLYVAATAGEWESVLCDAPHVNDEVRMIEGPVTRANGKKFVPVISRISPRADADFIAAAKNTWPSISARLRAAEAEVERLRGALSSAIEELDTIPEDPKRFARVAGMTIPLVRGGLSKALLPAEARAALGETP